MLSLDKLKIKEIGIIKEINCDKLIKTRLLDMGFNKGELIMNYLNSPSKSIKAYLIKNTLIALRNHDANNIKVEVINEKDCSNW